MRVRAKICGITRPDDARLAAAHGADAIGLVFYAPSPRVVSIDQAREIAAAVPAFVTITGLFVDAPAAQVEATLAAVPLDLLQFHGAESPADCARFARPWIKAVRMRETADVAREAAAYAGARALLLDSYQPGTPGGTGKSFDWARIPAACDLPLILAGGLSPDNVADAIRSVRPWAVDVSGGVESGKGIKDADKITRFLAAVARVNQALRQSQESET